MFFAVVWWIYTPHDGRRVANSDAQEEMMKAGSGHNMTDEERTAAAMTIWKKEKGTAAAVIIVGWCIKVRSLFHGLSLKDPYFVFVSPVRFTSRYSSTPTRSTFAKDPTVLYPTPLPFQPHPPIRARSTRPTSINTPNPYLVTQKTTGITTNCRCTGCQGYQAQRITCIVVVGT